MLKVHFEGGIHEIEDTTFSVGQTMSSRDFNSLLGRQVTSNQVEIYSVDEDNVYVRVHCSCAGCAVVNKLPVY